MKREKTFIKGGVFAVLLLIFAVAIFAGVNSRALAAVESGEDYTFETVPVEKIEISVDGNLSKVQRSIFQYIACNQRDCRQGVDG